jgi:hypothetical protein
MGVQGRMGLPLRIHEVRLLRAPDAGAGPLYAVITPDPEHGRFDAEIVDAAGSVYLQLSGYSTVAFPDAVDATALKALRAAMSLEAVAA